MIPLPGPAPYPPPPGPYSTSGYHMPYYYPPNYNGAMTSAHYFQQGYHPSNGQYFMNAPPQGYRTAGPVPPQIRSTSPSTIPEVAEHQKANTIQNDVNLKKATLRLEKDEENPGFHLVAFSFDATVSGRYALSVQPFSSSAQTNSIHSQGVMTSMCYECMHVFLRLE